MPKQSYHQVPGTRQAKEEYHVDVVIVGSGIAGSTAAMVAAQAGSRVAIVEKMPDFGGNAALSAGMYWTAPTFEAYKRRIPDGNAALGKLIVEQFQEGLQLIKDSGVQVSNDLTENIMTFGVGHSFDIRGFLEVARDQVLSHSGRCDANTRVTRLLVEDGRVTGVEAQRRGNTVRYIASAVILATGGFQASTEEVKQHIPQPDALVLRSNPGSTGDGLNLVRQVGITEVGDMGSFYGHLLPYPLDSFEQEHYLPYSQYYSEATVLLNMDGKRFFDETQGDEILNQKLVHQPQARGVMIFDDHVRRTHATSEPFPGLGMLDRVEVAKEAGGHVAEASTLTELFRKISDWGINATQVRRTVDQYIRALQHHDREADGVRVSSNATAPRQAPYYAVMVQPSITFTFGGIPVTPESSVLKTDSETVQGLYAAGADVGGISATGYAGGLAPALITGMTAGKSAVQTVKTLDSLKEAKGV